MSLVNELKEGIKRLALKSALIFVLTFGALLVVVGALTAASGTGCIEADEFDVVSSTVDSYPVADGVDGTYDAIDGGQKATWHDTGYKSNGEQFVIQVAGSWTPWNRGSMSDTKLANLSRCNFCARTKNASNTNCICYANQTPTIENAANGRPMSTVAGYCGHANDNYTNQNDPLKCSCTQDSSQGTALGYGTYHIQLNTLTKEGTTKIADEQTYCKYDRGMGLYIALFGPRGVTTPLRAYHLFSEEESCNVVRNSQGQCLNSSGVDVTRHVFRSKNGSIFMKDDHAGNTGIDGNTSDDEYHKPNEAVKLIIYDRYYADNYGQYTVYFLKGVGVADDVGLLEFLVRIVEGVLLGDVGEDGERHGGIIEFMYKSIVQDSLFIMIVQFSLSFYIIFFGMAVLMGVAEITRKELMNRVLKIGLIIFFTNPNSWHFYNKIVVGFFKDGMDAVVAMMMNLSDSNQEPSSMTIVAQMDRATSVSNSTRFSYVDNILKKLFSVAVAKKIFSLMFSTGLGLIYILAIYALIGFFLYVMLLAAVFYVINLIKLIFALSLGPIFICFSLFSHTQEMFKNWLSFLGTRSLEIVFIFTILYYFISLIDRNFTALLSYQTCVKSYNIGLFSVKFMQSTIDRSIAEWMTFFFTIGGLIFMMKIVFDKLPNVCGALISIAGVQSGDSSSTLSKGGASSSMNLAKGMMSSAMGLAKSAASTGFSIAGDVGLRAANAASAAAKASGLTDKLNAIGEKIPFRGASRRFNDSKVDSALNAAKEKMPGATVAQLRMEVMSSMQKEIVNNPKDSAVSGLDLEKVARRLDERLVRDGMKDKAQEIAKNLKKDPNAMPIGQAFKDEVAKQLKEWVKSETSDSARADKFLKETTTLGQNSKFNDAVNKTALNSEEAAKLFAGNKDAQNKYLDYLKSRQFENKVKDDQAGKVKEGKDGKPENAGAIDYLAQKMDKLANNIKRTTHDNPLLAEQNFLRQLAKEEAGLPWYSTAQSRFSSFGKEAQYEGVIKGHAKAATNATKDGQTAFFVDKFKNSVAEEAKRALSEMKDGTKTQQEVVSRLNSLVPKLGDQALEVLKDVKKDSDAARAAKGKAPLSDLTAIDKKKSETAAKIADLAVASLSKSIVADKATKAIAEIAKGVSKEKADALVKDMARTNKELGAKPGALNAALDATMVAGRAAEEARKVRLDTAAEKYEAEMKKIILEANEKAAESREKIRGAGAPLLSPEELKARADANNPVVAKSSEDLKAIEAGIKQAGAKAQAAIEQSAAKTAEDLKASEAAMMEAASKAMEAAIQAKIAVDRSDPIATAKALEELKAGAAAMTAAQLKTKEDQKDLADAKIIEDLKVSAEAMIKAALKAKEDLERDAAKDAEELKVRASLMTAEELKAKDALMTAEELKAKADMEKDRNIIIKSAEDLQAAGFEMKEVAKKGEEELKAKVDIDKDRDAALVNLKTTYEAEVKEIKDHAVVTPIAAPEPAAPKGFAPTSFEFEAGSSITETMLKGGVDKFTLKGDIAKAFLGAADALNKEKENPNAEENEKKQKVINSKISMFKLNLKMKQYEKDNLESEKDPKKNASKIRQLEAEINEIESDIASQENSLSRIDTKA